MQVVNSGVSTTWTVCRESDPTLHQDYFPHAAGDGGSGECEPYNPLKGFEFDEETCYSSAFSSFLARKLPT